MIGLQVAFNICTWDVLKKKCPEVPKTTKALAESLIHIETKLGEKFVCGIHEDSLVFCSNEGNPILKYLDTYPSGEIFIVLESMTGFFSIFFTKIMQEFPVLVLAFSNNHIQSICILSILK